MTIIVTVIMTTIMTIIVAVIMTLIVTVIMTMIVTLNMTLLTPVGHQEAVPGHGDAGVEWDTGDRSWRHPPVPRGPAQQCPHRGVSRLPAHPQ